MTDALILCVLLATGVAVVVWMHRRGERRYRLHTTTPDSPEWREVRRTEGVTDAAV